MNPGSGTIEASPVDQQVPLFSLFGETEATLGVRLTDNCFMVPDETISCTDREPPRHRLLPEDLRQGAENPIRRRLSELTMPLLGDFAVGRRRRPGLADCVLFRGEVGKHLLIQGR